MKLTCDLCGGTLQTKCDGQGAACQNCGLEYSMETLRRKLASDSTPASPAPMPEVPKPTPTAAIPHVAPAVEEEEPIFDAVCETVSGSTFSTPSLSRDKVLNIWRQYLPQAMPQYGLGMRIYGTLKGLYLAPDIPVDCAQRASRYLAKGKLAPQDILGHFSFKPQGGLAGIVVAQDRMFLPVGKLGVEYLEIIYGEISHAEVKKADSPKVKTTVALITYANALTLYYKDGRVQSYTTNSSYNAAPIAQALNELSCCG